MNVNCELVHIAVGHIHSRYDCDASVSKTISKGKECRGCKLIDGMLKLPDKMLLESGCISRLLLEWYFCYKHCCACMYTTRLKGAGTVTLVACVLICTMWDILWSCEILCPENNNCPANQASKLVTTHCHHYLNTTMYNPSYIKLNPRNIQYKPVFLPVCVC